MLFDIGDDSDNTDARVVGELPDVTQLNDVVDAMEMCDAHGVPYDGLGDKEEFIERLILHFQTLRCSESRKVQVEKSMNIARRDDEKRRDKLSAMMKEILAILHRQNGNMETRRDSQFLQGLLRTEGTTDNLLEDCQAHHQAIENGDCVVIVAGETSAGKSSVLNLLFGETILPVHNNSSTSTITIIRYHRRKHARIVYKTDTPDVVFELDQEGLEKLHAVAFMKSASERERHNIREVQVYLPIPILQSGLVLVDTPGIGENEFLENELTNFIRENTILGFMYIIKTDNAGGVQEDRLLGLLKIVLDMHTKSDTERRKIVKFDPSCALFVCNRVDLVDEKELDRVKRSALEKLSECWPSFDESQVIFFSTSKACRDIQANEAYVNDNYMQLLNSLKNLFISSMDRRIRHAYKWIENVLKRSMHHLRTVVKRLDLSDMDLTERSDTARAKLNKLNQKSDSVFNDLRSTLDSKCSAIIDELKVFLLSDSCVRRLLQTWSLREIPNVDNGLGDWPWIREKIHEVFYDKLIACVEEWDRNNNYVERIEREMTSKVKLELMLLEEELNEVEKEIQGETSSTSSDSLSALARSRRKSVADLLPGKYKHQFSAPKLPLKMAGRVIQPFKELLMPVKNRIRVSEYTADPVGVAERFARKTYDELLKDSIEGLSPLANYLLQRPRDYIYAVERRIPVMILANQILINNLEKQADKERKYLSEYEEMMTSTEALRRSLMEYGEGFIFVADFSRGELQIQQLSGENGREFQSVAFDIMNFHRSSSGDLKTCERRDIRGLWTVVYSGCLNRNGLGRPVAIKVYLPSSGVEFTYKEVAKLRCLTCQNTNIAEFLGIYNAEAITPAFVFAGELRSARRSLAAFCNKREAVPEILTGTASGLEYLHKKGLVHMELTQDTITVDDRGEVQLTGACLPRPAKLPFDSETIETGNFVYLAPEVLMGQTYETPADVYSFGLLVLELVQADTPVVFNHQRNVTLCEFIKTVDPDRMLSLESVVEVFTVKVRTLIMSCLEKDCSDRPAMDEVVEYTQYIKDETDALAKLPTRRSRRAIRRSSQPEKRL